MLDFSLIGYGGYVAPRHVEAIKETGNRLISTLDLQLSPADHITSLFPENILFHSFESYNDFHSQNPVDFVSICTPNDQHFKQIEWALGMGSHVICEKPIVTDSKQLLPLIEMEKRSGKKINTILQLRALQQVIDLKAEVQKSSKRHQIDLTYLSRRDEHYFKSWKADDLRSGGLITNIGIHLFDLVLWIFGPALQSIVFEREKDHATGFLELEKADVRWILDIGGQMVAKWSVPTYRELKINGMPLRLDQGLERLHQRCYEQIFQGNGVGIAEASESIILCELLNSLKISNLKINKYCHPLISAD